jgi:NADH:ubiquinone oxidoreductase subunit K
MTTSLLVGTILLFVGLYGVISKKNLIMLLMSVELMLNGVNITLMTFARANPETGADAHFLVLLIFAIAACEAACGLTLIVTLFRQTKNLDIDQLCDS